MIKINRNGLKHRILQHNDKDWQEWFPLNCGILQQHDKDQQEWLILKHRILQHMIRIDNIFHWTVKYLSNMIRIIRNGFILKHRILQQHGKNWTKIFQQYKDQQEWFKMKLGKDWTRILQQLGKDQQEWFILNHEIVQQDDKNQQEWFILNCRILQEHAKDQHEWLIALLNHELRHACVGQLLKFSTDQS